MTRFTGSSWAFVIAVGIVLVWGLTGPMFGFSDTWQLVINTGTTVVTFLMVFLIQHLQNKDSLAMQLKLNELIASSRQVSNRLVNVEDLSDAELHTLRRFYERIAEMDKKTGDIHATHSIDEADALHVEKQRLRSGDESELIAAAEQNSPGGAC